VIYKLCSRADWDACQREGRLPWAPVDREDGFVHLSAAHQVQGTAAKHFRGRPSVMVLEVDPAQLPEGRLRWEVSRGGERFPHVYGELPREAVVRAEAAPLDGDGVPSLPWGLATAERDDAVERPEP